MHSISHFFFQLPHQWANLLGETVALRLQLLRPGLQALAFVFHALEGGHVEHEVAAGKALGDGVELGAEKLDIEIIL